MTARRSTGSGESTEQGAFMALVDVHAEALSRLALRLMQSQVDGDALVRDVMEKLYVHRYRLAHVHDLRPWLFKVMYHQFVRSRWQRHGHWIGSTQDAVESPQTPWICAEEDSVLGDMTGPEECAFRLRLKDYLDAAMDELSIVPTDAVSRDLENFSLWQIAERWQVSVHTLHSALVRARTRLRVRLEQFELVSAELSRRRIRFAARRAADRSGARRSYRRRGGGGGRRGQASP